MDRDVQTEKVNEGIILAESKEMGKVPRIVLGRVNSRNLTLPINITEYTTGNIREFRDA